MKLLSAQPAGGAMPLGAQRLVLDEATSHLDVGRERQVRAAVNRLKITRIVIAHRPETITSVDRMLVVNGGRCR